MMIRIAILVVTCWSIVTSRGIPLSSKDEKSCHDLLDEGVSNGFDFLGAVGIDSQGSVKTGVTKVNGSYKDATAFRISPEARLRMPTRSLFPKGFPTEFSLQALLRAREPKIVERWELIRIEGPSGSHQFGIIIYGVEGIIKMYTSYYKRNAINGIYFYDTPLLKQLFDGRWHKLEFSFARDKLELYVDCELKASRELDESDSIHININGEIVVAVKADGTSPMFDLQSVTMHCDPASEQQRRCDDIERLRTTTPAKSRATTKSTTQKLTTQKPTTQKPTTQKPTTQKPTTQKPTTLKPSTKKPSTKKPTANKPTTQKPTTPKPTTKKPMTQKSTTQKPTTRKPTVQKSTIQTPTTQEPPTTQQPKTTRPTPTPELKTTPTAAEPKMEEVAVGSGDNEPRTTSTTAEPTTEEVALGSGYNEPVENHRVSDDEDDKRVPSGGDGTVSSTVTITEALPVKATDFYFDSDPFRPIPGPVFRYGLDFERYDRERLAAQFRRPHFKDFFARCRKYDMH